VLRLGIPLEFPFDVLRPALAELAAACPDTKGQALHLSTSQQVAALSAGELDVGLLRERPGGEQFDAMPVTREELGVRPRSANAAAVAAPMTPVAPVTRATEPVREREVMGGFLSTGLSVRSCVGSQPPDPVRGFRRCARKRLWRP
jgi:DNA-binding transcriptional LysR family regulator